jgi:hypothetical protein
MGALQTYAEPTITLVRRLLNLVGQVSGLARGRRKIANGIALHRHR